jgi:hypothetical protein
VTPEKPHVETKDIIEELIAASRPAFEATRAEREAIGEVDDVPEDVHVLLVVLAIVMCAPQIEETVEVARARVPASFDLRNVTQLRIYAAAAWHAYVRTVPLTNEVMQAVFREAIPFHRSMIRWARRLAGLGWIRREPLAHIGRDEGPRALAHELIALAEWLTEAWPHCEPLGLHGSDLARSTALGVDVFVVLSPEPRRLDEEARRSLACAFELMARAYDECRRIVAWVRHREGDLEAIAPALDALGQSPHDPPRGRVAAPPEPARRCLPN